MIKDLYDVKRIVEKEGLVGVINPVLRCVEIKSDEMDEHCIAMVEPTGAGGVQHDGTCQEGVVAKDEAELRAWCERIFE